MRVSRTFVVVGIGLAIAGALGTALVTSDLARAASTRVVPTHLGVWLRGSRR